MNVHSQRGLGATRRAILEAALRLFADRGFSGTAVPELARAAGVAAGTIYRHFDSKEQLVNVLYRECKAELMTALAEGMSLDASPRRQFHVFWWNLIVFARAAPQSFRFLELHHHAPYLDQESRGAERQSLGLAQLFVTRATANGVTKPMPPAALISIVWGAFVRLVKSEQEGQIELTDTVLQQAEQACWDAISLSNRRDEGAFDGHSDE
jgi:TetR/AcrR family transcriptional regulator, repressor of fatR-cypB operon